MARVRGAGTFADLCDGETAETAYRKWAKLLHPDGAPAESKPAATAAFAKLSGLYHDQEGIVHSGDIADLSVIDGGAALLKVPRAPRDNDLMAAEAEALAKLRRRAGRRRGETPAGRLSAGGVPGPEKDPGHRYLHGRRPAERLVGDGLPEAMRRFADGCSYDAPRMRPQDAWSLLGEFDELLHKLYGPRTFRPFHI